MRQIKLGKTGPTVSALGLGCWSFAGAYGPTDEAESHAALAHALDQGIDFFDTANVYGGGVSEQVTGRFLKDHPGRFKIATKGGLARPPQVKVRGFNNSPEHMRFALEKSLTDLGMDYVDLYYIHRREAARPIEEVMDTMMRFKQEGKIGGIGFSEIAPYSLRRACAVGEVMAVQSEYSLWSRMPEMGMIETCKELGVTFVAFSPVGRGMFGDTPPVPSEFGEFDFRLNNPRFLEPNFSANVKLIEPFKEYARSRGTSPAALATAWVMAQGDHIIPIPGTRTAAHAQQHIDGEALELTQDDLDEIGKLLPRGFAHGDRYSDKQIIGAERYC